MTKLPLVPLLLQASTCLAFSPGTGPSSRVVAPGSIRPALSAAVQPKKLQPSSSWSLSSSANDGDGAAAPDNNPFGFLQGIFSSSPSAAVAAVEEEPKLPDVVIDTDYTLAAAFAAVGVAIVAANHGGVGGVLGGGFVTLLASLFAVQATRLRFVFDNDSFELKAVDSIDSDELTDSGENIVVGGANRWTYDSFVNWDFYPSVDFPILVYFKETQTSTADGNDGQIHFFPAIANVKQLEEQFELRGCARVSKD